MLKLEKWLDTKVQDHIACICNTIGISRKGYLRVLIIATLVMNGVYLLYLPADILVILIILITTCFKWYGTIKPFKVFPFSKLAICIGILFNMVVVLPWLPFKLIILILVYAFLDAIIWLGITHTNNDNYRHRDHIEVDISWIKRLFGISWIPKESPAPV